MDTQELVDIRHQAEFFMSLGQHDQAIEILEHRLAESGESSPLVFLDLLGILHTLGRKSEYEVVRSEFNRLFTGRMSGFTAFSDEGKTLDAYPDVARRICALWPSARVLEFMEDCIFRNPGDEEARGTLSLHADEHGSPAGTALASWPIALPAGDTPRWVCSRLPAPRPLAGQPWWLVCRVEHGSLQWYADTHCPDLIDAASHCRGSGPWLPLDTPAPAPWLHLQAGVLDPED